MCRGARSTAQGRDDKLRDVLLVARLRREGKGNLDPGLFLPEPRQGLLSDTAQPGIDFHDDLVGYTSPINSPNDIHISLRDNILIALDIRENRGRPGYLLTIAECWGYSFPLFRTDSQEEAWADPSVLR